MSRPRVLAGQARRPNLGQSPASLPAALVDHYRCPTDLAAFGITDELSPTPSFFTLGQTMCYGRRSGGAKRGRALVDVAGEVVVGKGYVDLPFDLSEVVTNLQQERYQQGGQGLVQRVSAAEITRQVYYGLRPLLGVSIRKRLQKVSLSGWERIAFPRWPVDFTVENLLAFAMRQVIEATGIQRVPFIWFWPDGVPSCTIMTHDVESEEGRDFCGKLMDLDDEYGIKAAFQVVPEHRYAVSAAYVDAFHRRGFEVNVHDLNHDGQLFRSRRVFSERAVKINEYARKFQSRGFRAGIMYRRQEWFGALDGFSYDMSVPNVAHLEPQRGGCCTVTPYFIGHLLELPLTTIQDYSLFHILEDYSIAPWVTQIDQIIARHGLVSFITHPDYLVEDRGRAVYTELLAHLHQLRCDGRTWIALPREVDAWWRRRNEMTLVKAADSWRVEGAERERARVAYARLEGDQLVYEIEDPAHAG